MFLALHEKSDKLICGTILQEFNWVIKGKVQRHVRLISFYHFNPSWIAHILDQTSAVEK